MKQISLYISALTLGLVSQSAWAQPKSICSEILKFGIRDHANVLTSDQIQSNLSRTKLGGFDFTFGDKNLNGRFGDTKRETYSRALINDSKTSFINKNILSAWTDCISNPVPDFALGDGFEHYVEIAQQNSIRYRYRYGAPFKNQSDTVEIKSVSILPTGEIQCTGQIPKKGEVLSHGEGWREMTCAIDVAKGFDISVVTTDSKTDITSVVVAPRLEKTVYSMNESPDDLFIPTACIASGDSDIAAGANVYPGMNQSNSLIRKIKYAVWDNTQCGTSSSGNKSWFITNQGTCITAKGNGNKGCQSVEGFLLPD